MTNPRLRTVRAAFFLAAFALAGPGAFAFAADIKPIPLTDGANTAFADDTADDQKGGWTDQGSNDLRVIKPGALTAGGIPFHVLDDKETGGKSCVVVAAAKQRGYLPKQARVKLPEALRGTSLYLLHAAAWVDAKQNLVGRLTVEYADGAEKEFRVRSGRDVCDWWKNSGAANAARAWTAYNNNSQVSLYVSRFGIEDKEVAALRFDAGAAAVWMVAGAALGGQKNPIAIASDWSLKRDYPAPTPPDAAELAKFPKDGQPRNIIFIIGDGMGQAAVRFAGAYAHGAPQTLAMDRLPVRGVATTVSANAAVTDSAASGTALSSGYKTNNGMLGMDPEQKPIRSIAEEARDSGRAVGIVTTDALNGATPSAFYAHVKSRGMGPEIAEYALSCGFDLLIGSSNRAAFLPTEEKGARKDGRRIADELAAKGYTLVDSPEGFEAAEKTPVLGFIGDWEKDTQRLSRVAAESFRRLAENPKGFFIMVEGSYPDYGGHGNNPDLSVNGTLMVDFVVKAALDFAAGRGDTLVVLTADHETGGLYWAPNPKNPRQPIIGYMTKGHTGVPVDVFAFGPGADNFAGPLDNTQIPTAMAKLLNLPLGVPYASPAGAVAAE